MSRGPGRIASDWSVRDRLRRLPRNARTARAKDILRKDPDSTLEAMEALRDTGVITQAHVDAHVRWISEQLT